MSKKNKEENVQAQIPIVFFNNEVSRSDQFNEIYNKNYVDYVKSLSMFYNLANKNNYNIIRDTKNLPIHILINGATNNITDFIMTILYKSLDDIDDDIARQYIFGLYNLAINRSNFVNKLSASILHTINSFSDELKYIYCDISANVSIPIKEYDKKNRQSNSAFGYSFELTQLHNVITTAVADVFITFVDNLIINMVNNSQLTNNSLDIYVTMFKLCFGSEYIDKDYKPLNDQYEFSASCLREIFFSEDNMKIFHNGIEAIIDNVILNFIDYTIHHNYDN